MRKDNRNNPLQIRIQAASIPKSVRPETYLQRLMQNITEGRELPPKWDVRIHWRNPGTRHGLTKQWRYDSFEDAIAESRPVFGEIVYGALQHQLRNLEIRRRLARKRTR